MTLDDLQKKIERKINLVHESLETLTNQYKTLQKNADMVKTSINSSVEKQKNSLKLRERQLIRQIEVVTSQQKSILDSQITKLMEIKGSLTATQEILQQCQPQDLESLMHIYEECIFSLKPASSLKFATVQLDENPLSLAIGNFGKVGMPDINIQQHSCVIPSKMEEYGDGEHEILHKSLSGSAINSAPGNTSISIQFPKIPPSGWLAKSPQKETTDLSSDRKLSKDVSTWLADLKFTEDHEEKKLGSSYDLVEDFLESSQCKKDKSRRSSFSSSIEIVSHVDSEKDSCYASNNDYNCLKACFQSSGILERKHEAVSPASIEDFACQANELCNSYDDCLCNGYCKELANERATQTSRWLMKTQMPKKNDQINLDKSPIKIEIPHSTGIKRKLPPTEGKNEVLKHMRSILNSDSNKWLSSKSTAMLKSDSIQVNQFRVTYNPPTKSWLFPKSFACRPAEVESQSVRFSPHSNIWLLQKWKEGRKQQKEQFNQDKNESDKIENSLKTENVNKPVNSVKPENSVSLTDLKDALAELSVVVSKYPPSGNKYGISNSSSVPLPSSLLFSNQDSGVQRKLKWLARSDNGTSTTNIDITSRSSSYLPESLVALAESKLDRWLINRF